MNENEILMALKVLKEDEKELEAELMVLRSIISRYESKVPKLAINQETVKPSSDVPVAISSENGHLNTQPIDSLAKENKHSDFPKDETTQDQIIYILRKIGRLIRFPELHKELNEAIGETISEHTVRTAITKLRENKEMVAVKFNNANMSVFLGLSEWLETNERGEKTFKEEHRPSKRELPIGYNTMVFM